MPACWVRWVPDSCWRSFRDDEVRV